jgi:Haem-degrading
MDLEKLEAEWDGLVLPRFDEATALRLGQVLVELALAEKLPVVIDIRTADRTLFHAALPGAAPLNDLWARRKSNTALMFQLPSLLVGRRNLAKGEKLDRNGRRLRRPRRRRSDPGQGGRRCRRRNRLGPAAGRGSQTGHAWTGGVAGRIEATTRDLRPLSARPRQSSSGPSHRLPRCARLLRCADRPCRPEPARSACRPPVLPAASGNR